MYSNVLGRVRHTHLPRQKALLPVFEAIINSIDAIDDAGRLPGAGRIDVKVIRHQREMLAEEGARIAEAPVYGFEIVDNGVGFTESNFESFNTADSMLKYQRGGKGRGRFLWLKAFDRAELDSVYEDRGENRRRTFTFSLESPTGITGNETTPWDGSREPTTSVKLLGLREEYEVGVPRRARTIADRIVEHCLEYFVLERMPRIRVIDAEDRETIDLHELYYQVAARNERVTVDIGGHEFDVYHFLLKGPISRGHRIHLCANQRSVQDLRLENRIPHLNNTLFLSDDEPQVLYAGYVSSDFLDKAVDPGRTSFRFGSSDGIPFPGDLTSEEVEGPLVTAAREFLEPFTEEVKKDVETRVREYVQNSSPKYRLVLARSPEIVEKIPANAKVDQIDAILHGEKRRLEVVARENGQRLMEKTLQKADGAVDEDAWEKWVQAWSDENEIGKATLAEYILHRKRMLAYLDRSFGLQADTGRFAKEAAIHRIIYPLGTTSDEIDYEEHNLWILDERLAYHRHLASDLPLRKIEPVESESLSRPDLAIFNGTIAVVEDRQPYHSGIVIFEFKRPERNDYRNDDNPISQVYSYAEQIRSGLVKDRRGKPIRNADSVPFYGYIVADLTPKLETQARNAMLKKTPDGEGYFGFNENYGIYMEVISYDKLLSDAQKRNQVLFDKLNVPRQIDPLM